MPGASDRAKPQARARGAAATRWHLLLALAAALLPAACAPGGDGGEAAGSDPSPFPAAEPWPDAVTREVLAMGQADQRIRETIASLIQSSDPDSAALQRATVEQKSIDEANTARLREIVREHGWPAKSLVGSQVATASFLIVQHADHDLAFQKEYLTFVEREYSRGEAPGEAVALLTDRTRLAQGMPQLYGTQVDVRAGELVIQPVHDEDNLDQRRAQLGMAPMATYLDTVKRTYGVPE